MACGCDEDLFSSPLDVLDSCLYFGAHGSWRKLPSGMMIFGFFNGHHRDGRLIRLSEIQAHPGHIGQNDEQICFDLPGDQAGCIVFVDNSLHSLE